MIDIGTRHLQPARMTPGHPAMRLIAACIALTLPLATASAQDNPLPAGFKTTPVVSTGVTRDGDPLVYPSGTPAIISVIGEIEPGGRTPLHQHPVPVYVYILEGEVELRTDGGNPFRYAAGEAYIEALNRDHQLFNVGDSPAKVLVVFVGEDGMPTTVAAQ
jgi:quercetin dioxygenase-like cupin family protein